MRIVAGTARGRVLATPRTDEVTRPTADRVRETIFNVLGQWCDGLRVLDLFAGTGALGLEAVSRGAVEAVLVEQGREAVQLCRQNVEALRFGDRVEVLALPVARALETLSGRQFELVFSDPPYRLEAGREVLAGLEAHGLVAEGGVAVIEHAAREVLPEQSGRFARVDERRFGDTVVSIFRLTPPTP